MEPEDYPTPVWGSTIVVLDQFVGDGDCPTPVGVYRSSYSRPSASPRLPHAGGGLPGRFPQLVGGQPIAPRRWGSTSDRGEMETSIQGCPTQMVGVYPFDLDTGSLINGVAPRRWWGSTRTCRSPALPGTGCPTRVGIYPSLPPENSRTDELPHAGGGLPFQMIRDDWAHLIAPRRWGFTTFRVAMSETLLDCPTPVGFHLPGTLFCRTRPRLPHAGGGILS